jgi:L-ascorbate metabolism protein UlaG (beta-lactamase superfamily)
MRLTLIGHMTVRVELDGLALLTDPWFGPRTWLERRLAPRTFPPPSPPKRSPPWTRCWSPITT